MRYPNLRYGNPNELRHYMQGRSIEDVAKQFKRSPRIFQNYLAGRCPIPWWIPELMRLQRMEFADMMRQHGFAETRQKLGLVRGAVIELQHKIKKPPLTLFSLLKDDFDKPDALPQAAQK